MLEEREIINSLEFRETFGVEGRKSLVAVRHSHVRDSILKFE
jgi:hypothetical protein